MVQAYVMKFSHMQLSYIAFTHHRKLCSYAEHTTMLYCVHRADVSLSTEPFVLGDTCSQCPEEKPLCENDLCACEFNVIYNNIKSIIFLAESQFLQLIQVQP